MVRSSHPGRWAGTADREPTPINWRNLHRWVRRTRRLDRKLYREKRRPRTGHRLLRAVVPNLGRPIFLLGAPRSGTTFLGDAIGALPEVSYHYEPPVTKAAARYVYEGRWRYGTARLVYRQVYAWLMRLHLDGDLRFAEKTPQNCFVVPFLARAFRGAQFVHIIRDGRDAALSYSKQPWLQTAARDSGRRESGGYPFGPVARFWVEPERRDEFEATSDLHRCAWAWRRFTEAALAHTRMLPAARWCEVRYESLVRQPAQQSDRLLDFLGIADRSSRAHFMDAVTAARPDTVGRWRSEIEGRELERLEREAGPLLRSLGYGDG
jgi:hypothetical protein